MAPLAQYACVCVCAARASVRVCEAIYSEEKDEERACSSRAGFENRTRRVIYICESGKKIYLAESIIDSIFAHARANEPGRMGKKVINFSLFSNARVYM